MNNTIEVFFPVGWDKFARSGARQFMKFPIIEIVEHKNEQVSYILYVL